MRHFRGHHIGVVGQIREDVGVKGEHGRLGGDVDGREARVRRELKDSFWNLWTCRITTRPGHEVIGVARKKVLEADQVRVRRCRVGIERRVPAI